MATKEKRPSEILSFYGGRVKIEKKPWGDHYRFIKVGEKGGMFSPTRITKFLDKSQALIPWAVGLVGTHIKSTFELREGIQFSKEEIYLVVSEAILKPEEAKVKGGSTGDLIHDFAHAFALSKMFKEVVPPTLDHLDPEDPEHAKALNGINAFLDWYNGNKIEFLALEHVVYYNSFFAGDTKEGEEVIEYVGIMDVLVKENGEVKVMDYKTGKRVYSEQRYQLSSYRKAWNSNEDNKKFLATSSKVLNFSKETGELVPLEISNEESEKDFKAFKGLFAVAVREKELDSNYSK